MPQVHSDSQIEHIVEDLLPSHPENLSLLYIDETHRVECKRNFHANNFDEYIRTIAGLANNAGGLLVFGVEDASWEVQGLNNDNRFWSMDNREINTAILNRVQPSIRYFRRQIVRNGLSIGVMFVEEAVNKPIIIQRNGKNIKEGDIFFRYPGETKRIAAADLQTILLERDRQIEERWHSLIKRISQSLDRNGSGFFSLLRDAGR